MQGISILPEKHHSLQIQKIMPLTTKTICKARLPLLCQLV